jgi:hydrogenase-4 component F
LIVIFIGFLNHFRTMYFDTSAASGDQPAALSRWCVTPMWLALALLVVFGVWWPSELWNHFMAAAQMLTGPAP